MMMGRRKPESLRNSAVRVWPDAKVGKWGAGEKVLVLRISDHLLSRPFPSCSRE